jgi:hypothetical protein
MNCPYCDESIHLSAKFCPKCGLPLKDDATLMGGSTTVDEGPNRWVLIGGGAGVVALALAIGIFSASSGKARESVHREAVGRYFAPAPASRPMNTTYSAYRPAPVNRTGGGASYNAQVKWAWTPPKMQPKPPTGPEFEPTAPLHTLVSLTPKKQNATVEVVPTGEAAIPSAPAPVYPQAAALQGSLGTAAQAEVVRPPANHTWDPVQGRWAESGDRQPQEKGFYRGNNRFEVRQPANRQPANPQPANLQPANRQTGRQPSDGRQPAGGTFPSPFDR